MLRRKQTKRLPGDNAAESTAQNECENKEWCAEDGLGGGPDQEESEGLLGDVAEVGVEKGRGYCDVGSGAERCASEVEEFAGAEF